MASKWKYADLDANHRIGLLRKGYKELFDEEIARTKEITKARRELGLDTTEQEKWMDTVGYNYNLSMAGEGDKVSKDGYARLYLGEKKADTEKSPVKSFREDAPKVTGYISAAKRKITKAQELARESLTKQYEAKKVKARDELYDKYPYLKEQILNEGASPEGGKMKRAYDSVEKELSEIYAELDAELEQVLLGLDEKYNGFKDQISEYRRNGTAKESLGVIADVLIKNAAIQDGYDYSAIPGVGGNFNVTALLGKVDDGEDTAELSKEASDIIRRYPKKKLGHDNGYDEDEDTVKIREEKTSGTVIGDIADMLGERLKDIPADSRIILGTIGEMLVRNGMAPDTAARLASQLLILLLNRKAGEKKASAV
ncbi:MAG: hypothetical protein E7583_00690 [Ruminococcaceae bacterium]|nr:hypothetical protein [Oscillospiraceae bacterium]